MFICGKSISTESDKLPVTISVAIADGVDWSSIYIHNQYVIKILQYNGLDWLDLKKKYENALMK